MIAMAAYTSLPCADPPVPDGTLQVHTYKGYVRMRSSNPCAEVSGKPDDTLCPLAGLGCCPCCCITRNLASPGGLAMALLETAMLPAGAAGACFTASAAMRASSGPTRRIVTVSYNTETMSLFRHFPVNVFMCQHHKGGEMD